MKKLFPVIALVIAIAGAVSGKESKREQIYFRYAHNNPIACVLENVCEETGPLVCGHYSYTMGVITNCETPVVLRRW